MDFQKVSAVSADSLATANLVFLHSSGESRLSFSRSIATEALGQGGLLRVTTFSPSVVENSSEIPDFLRILQDKVSLPFAWASQIADDSIQDRFLQCSAFLGALVVSRAKVIQGLQDYAESVVMDSWRSAGAEASFSLVLDQIQGYINPRSHETLVSRLSRTDLPTTKTSIDYLVSGLIALKDAVSLYLEKSSIPESSTILVRNLSLVTHGFLNADRFVRGYFELLKMMGHRVVLIDDDQLPSHYLAMIDQPQLITDRQILDR
ncbi:hypothetical protein [Marinobacter sp. P4B1]|uniref:hypothetical protein n=1 Tax=Marinobacter sp. P4B1 TaxID=1119533 RepID=UPI00071C99F1|nr:hypothetical protein [Marinobacter sp. P4B1]KRW83712.1 hypothetical protein AQ621_16820 [Marinobacter sp. P4B1]